MSSSIIFRILTSLARGYEEPIKHLIKANIEYLKALNSIIEKVIKDLEKVVEEEPKKEKIKVE